MSVGRAVISDVSGAAARDVAGAAAGAAARDAAGAAADAAARDAAGAAARDLSRSLTKSMDEIASATTEAASKTQKSLTIKDTGVRPNKTTDVTVNQKPTKENVVNETPKSAAQRAKDFVANNPGKTIGGLAIATIAAMALINMDKSESTPRTIVKIESANFISKKKLKITFTPPIAITTSDLITFKGTKTTPSLDATQVSISGVVSDTVIIYDAPIDITSMTPGGQILVKSSFMGQVGNLGREASTGITDFFGSLLGIPSDWTPWVLGSSSSSSCCSCIILIIVLLMLGSSE